MVELIMLGTGNAMVTRCYNTCFALRNKSNCFLVDAGGGNGILTQLEKAGIEIESLQGMFVTHGHTDHILGAIWIIRKIAMQKVYHNYLGTFPIYCHDKVAEMLMTFCKLTLNEKMMKEIGKTIQIIPVTDGASIENAGLKFSFFDIHSQKTKQFGFKAILPDNRSLVCLGDEPCNEHCFNLAERADWMMAEAFCLYSEKDRYKPYEKHHSTAVDAAKIAEQLHIRNLLLYHTEDANLAHRKQLYSQEAKTVFSGNVFVPDDLEKIIL